MPADIMSTQAPSTFARLKPGGSRASKPNQPHVAPRPQDDPALIVGLALAFSRQGSSNMREIPSVVLEPLRRLGRILRHAVTGSIPVAEFQLGRQFGALALVE
mgnify:CR=1 FL=1